MKISIPSSHPSESTPVIGVSLILLLLATAHGSVAIDHARKLDYVMCWGVHSGIYLCAVLWILKKPSSNRDLILILVGALLIRGLATTALPYLTTDAFRYVWDGRVQWAGYSPYTYVPSDLNLAHLRDAKIYPHINQKETALSIYPPMAQLIFMLGTIIGDGLRGMKLTMVGFDLLTMGAIVSWLRSQNLPLSRVLIYAWHPLPIWEFSSQAHIDSAIAAFIALGLWSYARNQQGKTGALIACASAIKYYPAVLIPALWRKWDWRFPTAFVGTLLLLYAAYKIPGQFFATQQPVHFLFRHFNNEGYVSGDGYHTIQLVKSLWEIHPSALYHIVPGLLSLMILAVCAFFSKNPENQKYHWVALLGAAFVFFSSPHYTWYFGFLTVLLVLVPHPALFASTLLCVLFNVTPVLGISLVYILVFYLPLLIWGIFQLENWRQKKKFL